MPYRGSLSINVLDTVGLISETFGLLQGVKGGETVTASTRKAFYVPACWRPGRCHRHRPGPQFGCDPRADPDAPLARCVEAKAAEGPATRDGCLRRPQEDVSDWNRPQRGAPIGGQPGYTALDPLRPFRLLGGNPGPSIAVTPSPARARRSHRLPSRARPMGSASAKDKALRSGDARALVNPGSARPREP